MLPITARRALAASAIRRTPLSASLLPRQQQRVPQLDARQHALFSSFSSADPGGGLRSGKNDNPWKELGSAYSLKRKATAHARFPREQPIALAEFMTGAAQAFRTVFEQLYIGRLVHDPAASNQSEPVQLQQLATDHVVSVLTRKTRHPDWWLEQLQLSHSELVEVQYETKILSDAEAKQRGYQEDEWMRIKVAYEAVEYLVPKVATTTTSDDVNKLIKTSFTWTFEANVSDPEQVEWEIVAATSFEEKQVDAKMAELLLK